MGHVSAVAVGAETDNFGMDGGAARAGMLQLLENQRARAFAQHQAIALGIEWTRRGLGGIIAHAGGKQGIEHCGFGDA